MFSVAVTSSNPITYHWLIMPLANHSLTQLTRAGFAQLASLPVAM